MAEWVRVMVLGGFGVSRGGEAIALPTSAQRVVAFVALQERPVPRSYVSAALWLDTTEARAGTSLRSALWKLGRIPCELVRVAGGYLELAPHVSVDLRDSVALARLAITAPSWWEPAERDVTLLSEDLLPNWYDEWVVGERERFRQLRLHALESLCERLSDLGRHGAAVQAGLASVESDPLRESAQRALIRAFLAEGNVSEARRQYARFANALRCELDIEPSSGLRTLIDSWGAGASDG